MGLIKAIEGTIKGVVADQWKEYFYCESMEDDVLVTKASKRTTGAFGTKNNANDNLISNGSVVAVNEGQCMIIVDQGKVAEFCAEAGEYLYDTSSEPSLLFGDLGTNITETFKQIGRRFTFAGDTAKDQRVYFFNTKEIKDNTYGSAQPIPFRVVDNNIGLDLDTEVRCHGTYSYQIFDPILFYTNVCGNIADEYSRENLTTMLKAEVITALQPALAQISAMGIRYSAVPAHTVEMAEAMNTQLSEKWGKTRGMRIVSFNISPLTLPEEDESMIKNLQKTAVLRNPNMAAATMVEAQSEAMKSAASNTATGPMFAFAGMNMAQQAGGLSANALYEMGQKQNASNESATTENTPSGANGWTCSCGKTNTGKFCEECGNAKPASDGWTCSCGAVNKGKFCPECGAKKPAGEPLYRCDKCGWEPEDPKNPPKFCPECGDIFNEDDVK